FLFAAGFVTWAALFDRKRIAWRMCFLGTFLGAMPLVPWVYTVMNGSDVAGLAHPLHWGRLWKCTFWFLWTTDALGLVLWYSLDRNFVDFLSYPLVDGHRTYLNMVWHVYLAAVGGAIFLRGLMWLWRERRRWLDQWIGRHSATAFTVCAGLWGYGMVLSGFH